MTRRAGLAGLIALLLQVLPGRAAAQAETVPLRVRRTIFEHGDVPGAPSLQQVMGEFDIPAGGATGRHFHHGTEISHLIEGAATLAIDGEAPRMLKPGDSFLMPARKIHNLTADITGPARVIAVWVVAKDKPLVETVS